MSTAVAAPPSPYKGLAPYGDSDLDALFFFGRERERDVIVANLIAARLTVLYGASGVGKSSVLRAGVVRRLRALACERRETPEHEVVVVDVWSGDAVDAVLDAVGAERGQPIAAALEEWTKEHDAALYLILDQFDEYFLYHGDEEGGPLGTELAEVLTSPRLPVNVLISLREDALAQLDAFKGRVPNLFANSLRIDRLDRRGARAAIVGPIERYNTLTGEAVGIETALVDAVLDEVTAGRVDIGAAGRGEVPGAGEGIEAPYLQLVLERLWQVERDRRSPVLRLETFRDLGGAEAIVRAHLERALAALTPAQRDVAAEVFNYLVTPSGTKIAHRTADLAEYAHVRESELVPVLDALGHERIVRAVNGDPTHAMRYEIFHDVLSDAVLGWRVRQHVEHERRIAERRHRRLLAVTVASLVALACVAALAVYALVQRGDARAAARRANAHALDASALAALDTNPQTSLRLADRAALLVSDANAEETLRQALVASRQRKVLRVGGDVVAVSYSPDGRLLLVAAKNGDARLYDGHSARLLHAFGRQTQLRTAALSPDGRLVAVAGKNFRAALYDADSGRQLRTFRHGTGIRSVSFSADGSLLSTAGGAAVRVWRTNDGTLLTTIPVHRQVRTAVLRADGRYLVATTGDRYARVYDARSGRLVHTLDQGGTVTSTGFTPGGGMIFTSGTNDSARLWATQSGRLLHTLGGHEGAVLQAVADPRGVLLATASADGTARLWTLAGGRLFSQLSGHANLVTGAVFSSDGFFVTTWSRDGVARVWRPTGGFARAVLAGHDGPITVAAFNPRHTRIVTGSDDGTARIWDPQTEPPLALLGRYGRAVYDVARSPDGRTLLVGADDGARLVSARDGHVVRRLAVHGPVTAVAFGPDGRVATVARGRVAVWSPTTGRRLLALPGAGVTAVDLGPHGLLATAGGVGAVHLWRGQNATLRIPVSEKPLTDVRFDAAGDRFVVASLDKTATVYTTGGKPLQTLAGHASPVTSAAFSPSGRFVVTASRSGEVRVWNVATGRTVHRLSRHFGLVSDAEYSPDGRWIVTAGPVTAGLWSSSGRFYYFLRGHKPVVRSAVFEPGSLRIVTGSTDGTVRTYTCDVCGRLPALLALAGARLDAAR